MRSCTAVWGFVVSLGFCVALTSGCANDAAIPESAFRLSDQGRASVYSVAAAESIGYDVVAVITAGADGMPFGRIGALAAFQDGGFVVYESTLCRLHVFSAGFAPDTSFAGCGDGPEELRIGTKLLVSGDTILVLDTRRSRLVRFTRDGVFLDGVPVVLPTEGPSSIQDVAGFDEDGALVASFTAPLEPGEPTVLASGNPLLGRLNLREGTITEKVIVGHPQSAFGSGWQGLMGYPVCSPQRMDFVVMLNRWSQEVAIFSLPDFRPIRVSSIQPAWPSYVSIPESQFAIPSSFILGVACDETGVVAGQFRLDPENVRGLPLEGWLGQWDYDGNLISSDRLAVSDSALFGIPAAMVDGKVYIRNNTGLDLPAVVVARSGGGR